jgi:transcriptional regulator
MYVKPDFDQTDPLALRALMQAHPLGTWVTLRNGEPEVNHVPFLWVDQGPHGTLMAHVPRANPVWRDAQASTRTLVVFHGPQAYVSPSWYASKAQHGKVVPTWNYQVVHAHGSVRVIDGDADWLRTHLAQLTDAHESGLPEPWQLGDAPAAFTDGLMRALVGIEITLTAVAGKWKLSQNRSTADRQGVVAGLRARHDTALADAMAARLLLPDAS